MVAVGDRNWSPAGRPGRIWSRRRRPPLQGGMDFVPVAGEHLDISADKVTIHPRHLQLRSVWVCLYILSKSNHTPKSFSVFCNVTTRNFAKYLTKTKY